MKKLITSIACATALFFSANSNAQEVEFGAKAGINFSNASGDIKNNSAKLGFYVGGLADIKISDKFSIQPELVYSLEGYNLETLTVDGASITTEDKPLNLSYLNVAGMAKYYITDGLNVEAGPQIGFLLGASFDGESEISGVEIKDGYKSINFGLNFGAGYELESGLGFNARYALGLSSIAEDVDGESFSEKTATFSIGVFYKFNK
ncbi:porin family protein [Aureivirga marina]|uniref:porin family protein n=1 Tax=Aureivirga marina TaxID=1182451 RepID=UPI0018CB0123|nr:porin family protein [Aureivirga marina]